MPSDTRCASSTQRAKSSRYPIGSDRKRGGYVASALFGHGVSPRVLGVKTSSVVGRSVDEVGPDEVGPHGDLRVAVADPAVALPPGERDAHVHVGPGVPVRAGADLA